MTTKAPLPIGIMIGNIEQLLAAMKENAPLERVERSLAGAWGIWEPRLSYFGTVLDAIEAGEVRIKPEPRLDMVAIFTRDIEVSQSPYETKRYGRSQRLNEKDFYRHMEEANVIWGLLIDMTIGTIVARYEHPAIAGYDSKQKDV
jgi:hypothetical protein